MDPQSASDFFENEASGWDRRYERSRLFRLRYRVFSEAIAEHGRGHHKSLDYGCGSGVLTGLLQRSSQRVVATDIAENMLRITREKFRDCPNVEVTSIAALKPADFDLAVCSSVIEYVDEPFAFLQQVGGYLKPDGILLMSLANRYAPLQITNRSILKRMKSKSYTSVQKNLFSSSSIRRLADRAGLEIVSLGTPIGLPLFTQFGLGELFFLVGKKRPNLMTN